MKNQAFTVDFFNKILLLFKLIVATDQEQVSILDGLYERGLKNNVKDLRLVNADQIKEIEPNCVVTSGFLLFKLNKHLKFIFFIK